MIFLGPAGVPLSSEKRDTISGVRKVAELGLNAMEVEFVRGVTMSNEMAKKVGRVAKELGVSLSIHAPYYINLCNPEKARASIKRVLDSCERGHYMGARVVVFHPGFYGTLSREEAYKMVKDACVEMDDAITKNGWDVKLGLETTGKKSQFGTLDEVISVSREVKACMPVVDFAHLFARNGGKVDYDSIFEKVSKLKLKHVHAHFSGIEYTESGEKRHVPVGSKSPDFEPLARALLKRNVDITIISESPLLEKDALLMKATLEKMGFRFKR